MLKPLRDEGRWKLILAAVAAALSLAALGATLVYRTTVSQQFRQHTIAICLSVETLKADIRGTLQASRDRLVNRSDLDATERAVALMNLDAELRRYAPDECPTK